MRKGSREFSFTSAYLTNEIIAITSRDISEIGFYNPFARITELVRCRDQFLGKRDVCANPCSEFVFWVVLGFSTFTVLKYKNPRAFRDSFTHNTYTRSKSRRLSSVDSKILTISERFSFAKVLFVRSHVA